MSQEQSVFYCSLTYKVRESNILRLWVYWSQPTPYPKNVCSLQESNNKYHIPETFWFDATLVKQIVQWTSGSFLQLWKRHLSQALKDIYDADSLMPHLELS